MHGLLSKSVVWWHIGWDGQAKSWV